MMRKSAETIGESDAELSALSGTVTAEELADARRVRLCQRVEDERCGSNMTRA